MGIGAGTLRMLLALKREGYVEQLELIEIGAQQLDDTFVARAADIAAAGRLFGRNDARLALRAVHLSTPAIRLQARRACSGRGLVLPLIDIDGSPGSLSLDLNFDDAPIELVGRYDVVTNFGTTERCQSVAGFQDHS